MTTRPQPPRVDERLLIRNQIQTVQKVEHTNGGYVLLVESPDGAFDRINVADAELAAAREALTANSVDSPKILAALYGWWMRSAAEQMRSGALATKPLDRLAHQDEAVDRMIAQPQLRFLLGDEPGTGKTIMTGLYIVEARRRGLVRGNVLLVVPAHLIPKWQTELMTFFGVHAEKVTPEVGRQLMPLRSDVSTWIVSLDLYTYNQDVKDKLAGPHASWSLVVFDEAHRLTPSSQHLGSAQQLDERTRHMLLLTATPHRGSEEYFQRLMNLLDPTHYPVVPDRPCVPSSAHFLRRMKEDLKDQNGNKLFSDRFSETVPAPLTSLEESVYWDVQDYVDAYYQHALTIAKIVYGKRAASSPAAIAATLRRRADVLRGIEPAQKARPIDSRLRGLLEGESADDLSEYAGAADDDERWDEAESAVIASTSVNRREELARIEQLISDIRRVEEASRYAKWEKMLARVSDHGIRPGNDQLLVFTEYTDTAKWLREQFIEAGFSTEVLSGEVSDHEERYRLQERFLSGDYEVLVSTDAGGEGINLQSANVMINWDIPWSMVRLEQRMGRLHRLKQARDVFVYHLVSPNTMEGRVQEVMLENIEKARKSLSGRVYDLLDATASRMGFDMSRLLALATRGAADETDVPSADAWQEAAEALSEADEQLRNRTNMELAERRLRDDELEQINPVHVRRFLEAAADAQGWRLGQGPAAGIHILDASPKRLPAYLGGTHRRLTATDGSAAAEATRSGAVGLSEVIVFGPTETAFTALAHDLINDAMAAFASGQTLNLVDTESISPYLLGIFEVAVTMETDTGRVTRKVPFLARHMNPGEVIIPDWASVLRLSADAKAHAEAPTLTPAARLELTEAAREKAQTIVAEKRKTREDWVTESKRVTRERQARLRAEVAERPDEERREVLEKYRRQVAERDKELERMLNVDASDPHLIGVIAVGAGQTIIDVAHRPNSEQVAIQLVWEELERQEFDVLDTQSAGIGYDLKATNHQHYEHRCVEVKGQIGELGEVTLEQSEWSQAQQLGENYWLYIATNCGDPKAAGIVARIQDPASKFAGPRLHQRFTIRVSDLRSHLDE